MTTTLCPHCGKTFTDDPDVFPAHQLQWIINRVSVDSERTTPAGILNSRTRNRYLVTARRRVWLVLRLEGLSYPQIGRLFGRDHTTVMKGCKAATDFDTAYARKVHGEFRAVSK